MESRLNILSESLDKKIQVLREIQVYNEKQEAVLKAESIVLEDFDAAVEEKGKLIDKLTLLDEGFEILYAQLSEGLRRDKAKYAEQIRAIQDQIRLVTELSTSIQAQEARNKKLIEEYFAKARRGLGESRRSSKAAYDYYRSLSGAASRQAESQYMDSKK